MFLQEEYLRRARSLATPYKQIAAHLHKTELACRLHYHQINSSHRRQSGLAMDDVRGEESLGLDFIHQDGHPRLPTPNITVSYSPPSRATYSTSSAPGSVRTYTPPNANINTEWSTPQTYHKSSSSLNVPDHGVGLNWQRSSSSPPSAPPTIPWGAPDLGRLLYDYADSSRAFFSNLADQFSQSPAELEAAFRAALRQKSSSPSPQPDRHHLPPLEWPHRASDIYQRRSFSEEQHPIRSDLHAPSPKRCTVSSLLNSEKDTNSRQCSFSSA